MTLKKVSIKKILISAICILIAASIIVSCFLFFGTSKDFSKGWDNDNNGYEINSKEVDRLISVKPTERQVAFSDLEYYSFIHYGMNTFTDVEWGTGKESPEQFNPENVDTDQWVRVLKESGSKAIIFTAKHHDGFCLFQTEYTEHSIKNSPYKDGKGDIVAELAESCKKYDMLLGLYLSPWDMHEETYGTAAYDDYFVNQLTELCTNYGDIFAFWFDGAKGENAPDFEYDFDRYYEVIRRLQPNAIIANCGPDVRWIGNEAGITRKSEWSVISSGNAAVEEIMNNSQKGEDQAEKLQSVSYDAKDRGSRELLKSYRDLIWYPAEADVSIHYDWFYHDNSKKRTAKQLADIYFGTVGGNASLLLNVPPSKNGIIEEKDIKILQKFRKIIDEAFTEKLDYCVTSDTEKENEELNAIKSPEGSYMFNEGEHTLTFKFDGKKKVKTIVLQEDITQSQRIEEFKVYAKVPGGYKKISSNTVVGSKKIIRLSPLNVRNTDEIKIVFTQSRSNPVLRNIEFYA